MKMSYLLALVLCLSFTTCPSAAKDQPTVYVTFWFDTEDFILPQADGVAETELKSGRKPIFIFITHWIPR